MVVYVGTASSQQTGATFTPPEARLTLDQLLGGHIIAQTQINSLQVASSPPANAAATGVTGTITWDATHIYICIATNTWVRCVTATW